MGQKGNETSAFVTGRAGAAPERRRRGFAVLLVEGSLGEAELIREAFADSGVLGELHVARSGAEAISFLWNQPTGRKPDLILLDLVMPGRSGWEVLAEIGRVPEVRGIPVGVLISSPAETVLLEAVAARARFVTRPEGPHAFRRFIESILLLVAHAA